MSQPTDFGHTLFILIWDRANIHTSKKTTAYLAEHPNIIIEWLPAYAPELNPEEYCHGNVKQHLKNTTPANKDEMRMMVDRGFARLRRRPDLLLSFVHAAGLAVRQLWLNGIGEATRVSPVFSRRLQEYFTYWPI